jgi:site-specific DNA-methyltransferase (adenine-specific)
LPCILAGSKEGDTVLDPFSGSGTTGEVALKHGRNYIGLELNPEYAAISEKRISNAIGMFGEIQVA